MFSNKWLWLASAVLAVVGFMNCSQMESVLNEGNVELSTSGHLVGTSGVMFSAQPLHQITIERPLVFYTQPDLFEQPVRRFFWDHNLNNTAFCNQTDGELPHSVIITCDQSGELGLFLIVEYENGIDETYFASVEVLAEPGEPGPEEPGPVEPIPLDGQQLYTVSCAGCHGAGPTSEKRNRSAGQIQNAINANLGGMGLLSNLSSEEVAAIASYLNE
jgi:hypothetical protein